ncbi:autophagy protein 16 [Atractiella rhizophila]|nr:autophagy protein 16 [Atractiella rhizophila]
MSSFQHDILTRLQTRDTREKLFFEIISHYRALSLKLGTLRERNASLLRVGKSSGANPSSVTSGSSGADDGARSALIVDLEAQLKKMRDELSESYKVQGQNAQRLLVMNESLRTTEERSREQEDELRAVRAELERLRTRCDGLEGKVREKDGYIQKQQDDLTTANLEVDQLQARNEALQEDNATLLKRWLERMNDEASRMNGMTPFNETN